jgi:dTDP-4-dehydrorhamnose 3,5-epimerase
MPVITTPIEGLIVIEPRVFADDRGYFFESFNARSFALETGLDAHFVQDNQAQSARGVLRGLHFQTGASAQAKLVRVLSGEVFDVAVDLRPQSPTLGQWYGLVLSAQNKRQLFVPRGFAHGYLVLSDTAEFFYKCDNYYDPAAEGGLRYDDPALGINWPFPEGALLTVSDRDRKWPLFEP